jgi:DNA-binding NarL/FixJ family response regulator
MTADERRAVLARYREHAERFDAIARRSSSTRSAPLGRREPRAPTQRELEILTLIAEGGTNAEIASELLLSVETVKTRVTRLLARVGAANRAHAVALAFRHGWIRSDAATPAAA